MNKSIKLTSTFKGRRVQFLTKKFGKNGILLDHFIYMLAYFAADNNKGERWNCLDLTNGGCYVALNKSQEIVMDLTDLNGFKSTVNGDTFGLIISLQSISWYMQFFAEKMDTKEIINFEHRYHALMDYAGQHEDKKIILNAIKTSR